MHCTGTPPPRERKPETHWRREYDSVLVFTAPPVSDRLFSLGLLRDSATWREMTLHSRHKEVWKKPGGVTPLLDKWNKKTN